MNRQTHGILLRILSGILFTGMVACVKALTATVPLGEIVFFRSAIALVPLVVFLALTGEFPSGLRTGRPKGHVVRCIFGCVAMFTSFATLGLLPVAEATMISYLSPVAVVILAALILGEQILRARWIGVAMGMAGTLVILLPGLSIRSSGDYLLGIALGLMTAILTAGALIQVRNLVRTEHSGAIAFYFALTCALVGLATLPMGWSMPNNDDLLLLIGSGLFGGGAHIAMTVSFRHAEASAMAPAEYLTVLWAIVAGVVLFGEVPGMAFWLAVPLVLGGSLLAASAQPRATGASHRSGG